MVEPFLRMELEADRLYRKYINYELTLLQDANDPTAWLEIQRYPDQQSYEKARRQSSQDGEIERLWKEFHSLLDPREQTIREEHYKLVVGLGG